MIKSEFLDFYDNVVKKLGVRFAEEYPQFKFCDNPSSLYEEYLNQKTVLRVLYDKEDKPDKELLDRHKVCACMVIAIIKVRLLSGNLETDEGFDLSISSRINEQLAFMSVWELFKGFVRLSGEKENSVIRKFWITVSDGKNYLFQNKTCHFFLLVIQSS